MTSVAAKTRNIGTLIVVILKARNLPNKRQFGKQDPFCMVVHNGETRKTRVIRRGGQHPEWDEEVRFTIYEDPDALGASDDGTPPPLPPKAGRGPKNIQGGEKMALACFAADKEPEFIGETTVDLTEVLTKGETDEWFTLHNKDKYSGEVYLELTFWSNEPCPENRSTPKLAKVSKQYGGPGVFVPSDESPGHLQQRSGSSHDGHRRDSFPSSIPPSNSSMGLDLYKPEYEHTMRARAAHGTSMEQLVNDMGELVVLDSRRRDTFPPMQSGISTRSASISGHSSSSSSSSVAFPVSENSVLNTSTSGPAHNPVTPIGQRRHQYSLGSSQPHEIPLYQPAYEPSPPSLRSSYQAPSRHGPRYSMPAASSGFIPVSSMSESALHSTRTLASYRSEPSGLAPPTTSHSVYALAPTLTPAPTSFTPGSSVSPAPTASTSTSSFLSTSLPQQSQSLYVPQAGYNPAVSAPPLSHLPTPPLQMLPTPPHSTPPHAYPSLAQPVSGQLREYISPSVSVPQTTIRVVSNHVPGSRPLPPEPQRAMQRVPPSTSISVNQAYTHLVRSLPFQYGQNQMPPVASDGLPVLQNPLPIPPGPPGPLGPGSHTPLNSVNAIVSSSSSYRYSTSPSPQSSPSRQSPNLRISDGVSQSSSSLPPSPVPPSAGRPRTVSGRPSLPLPPPPTLPATGSSQQLPFPQLPIPPALPSSQSQQQYLTSSTSTAPQGGQSFYPGPPPRPPAQFTDPVQSTTFRQDAF
ncbi:hypothetical protein F5148DRAFT_995161 [Russula earlei]|uniref:Uncharacterized protein n=1 Tax=Russula earlei TaxID=71964 RepID=A0ACC0UF98_9AGAM|nr:hypothetical protein F5148DRAFT_995161 [Russula earlei]